MDDTTLLEQWVGYSQILSVPAVPADCLIPAGIDREDPQNEEPPPDSVEHPPIADASASREVQLDQIHKFFEECRQRVSDWDVTADSMYTRALLLGKEQLEIDISCLKDLLENNDLNLGALKRVERVAYKFRGLDYLIRAYKKDQQKEKAALVYAHRLLLKEEEQAEASGASTASGSAEPSAPSHTSAPCHTSAPQKGHKRNKSETEDEVEEID